MSASYPGAPAVDAGAIYNDEVREQFRRYYESRGEGRYWAYDFDKMWAKYQRGVRQESELADMVSRWIDFNGARVLVIGSYLGSEAIAYALRGARVVGIDLDEQALAHSRQLARAYGVDIDVYSMDATSTVFPDESFDYVSCAQVLEHLPPRQQPRLLEEMWRLCKPGGLFWLDTPNQLAFKDHHDTGLPFIHWLPRAIKVPLAKWLGRAVPDREPAFGNQPVYLHYYMGYFRLKRILSRLGRHEILSRYRGYADVDHYCAARRSQGRTGGPLFPLKTAMLRTMMVFWNFNWFSGIRLVVRKLA
jgi:2-polyprenyl-3-methyl-5-hydroxy-6-metoxy-1,4-benzoquinol methylase